VTARLRVLTANLRNGKADPWAFAALVAALTPDAVATQELSPEQAEALARVMPHGALAPARDHTGMGVALRRPGAVRRLPLPFRDAHVAEVALGLGEPVEIVNVHLLAPHARPPWWTVRIRRGQVRGLEAYLDATPRRQRIVLGDLNATPLWPAYRRLAARLADAAVEAARQNGHRPQRTWGPGSRAPRLLRIDHVLLSGVSAEGVEIVPLRGSDHAAVVADVRVIAVPTDPVVVAD
jgi:endonuclease/exonuclease/phosphatase (EEP) superfamily protein YafD